MGHDRSAAPGNHTPAGITPSLYLELEARARALLRSRRFGPSPETASLVNRACVNLLERSPTDLETRSRFLVFAAAALRNVLVDLARERKTVRRGGGRADIQMGEEANQMEASDHAPELVLDVHDRLDKLARHDQDLARLVQLRYFGGLTWPEVAEVMGRDEADIQKDWYFVRAWFRTELSDPRGFDAA